MKKNLFMVAAVALVALVSCNKETNSSLQPAPVSDIKFEAEIAQTKTSIGDPDSEGNRDATWVRGDQVNINGTLFTATGFKEDGKAIFETENLDFTVAEQYDAIYPATAGTSLEAVTIPAAQDGTFANAAIAVAQSENRSLSFLNVASLLRFQVPADYASVTIESTANLAGTVSVTFDEDGTPVIGEVTNASNVITLNDVKADVDYYVAILPENHKFTVRLDGYLSKASTKTLSIARANMINLQKLPAPEECEWYLVGQHQNWTLSAAKVTPLYKVEENLYVARNLSLKDSGFKLTQKNNTNWDKVFGSHDANYKYTVGTDGWYTGLYTNNRGDKTNDIKLSNWSGPFDVYIRYVQVATWGKELGFAIVKTGDAYPTY